MDLVVNRRRAFLRRHAEALGLLSLLVISTASLIAWITTHGVCARDQPTAVEALLARSLRHAAIPRADRALINPVPLTHPGLDEGRMHWADHCALCHGNDGKGNTEIGRNLYPKAPDMTAPATQGLSDGELFSIIKNGVRLTGMPAWGASFIVQAHTHKTLMGTVKAMDSRKIELTLKNGKAQTILLAKNTMIMRGSEMVGVDQVKPGLRVVVVLAEDDRTAETIKVSSAKPSK